MLELRHLRSLLAIADTGRLAAAAERVHLTQSALSHQLRALEAHYGTALFRRTRAGLRATPAGARLLVLAHDSVERIAAAERDLLRITADHSGELRIALECHTCFDWLMPVMGEFRRCWPEIEVDLVSGFHSQPLVLLDSGKADIVIGAPAPARRGRVSAPLFRFEIMAVLADGHPLQGRRKLEARDFEGETLITYPVPEERIDLIREVLRPAGVHFKRRTAELTVAIVQLVASRRGIAALPSWGLKSYLDHDYVIAKRIGARGLWSDLHAVAKAGVMAQPYAADLVRVIREQCAVGLDGIKLL